jgi:hypothetical protein
MPVRPLPSTPEGDEVRRRIIQRLHEVGGPKNCPVCGTNDWLLGSYVNLRVDEQPSQVIVSPFAPRPLPSSVYSEIAMFCNRCGNTVLLNLKLLGFGEEEWKSMRIPEQGG